MPFSSRFQLPPGVGHHNHLLRATRGPKVTQGPGYVVTEKIPGTHSDVNGVERHLLMLTESQMIAAHFETDPDLIIS